MDAWHRVGRILRVSNLGICIFFILNVTLIGSLFDFGDGMLPLIGIYIATSIISFTPVGELLLTFWAGAKEIKRQDIRVYVTQLLQLVLNDAKKNSRYYPKSVHLKIINDKRPNAYAIGRKTICITQGLLELPEDMIKAVLAHEIGHLAYGHSVTYFLISGGNIFITGMLFILRTLTAVISVVIGSVLMFGRHRVAAVITAIIGALIFALTWLWVKFCKIFLMWSMRKNEYTADAYAAQIGYGIPLAAALDRYIGDVDENGFFKALFSTHPCNDDRIAELQKIGVKYSRY